MISKQSGFTLLEALIAGLILFICISAATRIFSSSLFSNSKATQEVVMSGYTSMFIDHIRFQLDQGNISGKGHWMGVDFSWNAVQRQQKAVTESEFTGGGGSSLHRASLWQISLQLSGGRETSTGQFLLTKVERLQ